MGGRLVRDAGFIGGGGSQTVSIVGAATGEGSTNHAYVLPSSAQSKDAIACLCMDVSGHDVAQTIEAGLGHLELIKRVNQPGKNARPGRMCHTTAVHLCGQITAQNIAPLCPTADHPPPPPLLRAVGARI